MTDSNKKPAPAAPGKPAGPGGHRSASAPRKVGPGKTGQRAAARAKAKAKARGDAPAPKPTSTAPLTPAKRALAWAHTARFLTTASQLHHLPRNGVLPSQARDVEDVLDDDDVHESAGPASTPNRGAPAAARDQADEQVDAALSSIDEDDADVTEADGAGGAEGDASTQHLTRMLPEIAFVGRSNAGKSTAINTLAQQKRLAFASKTPGRTQHINLFALGPRDAPDALFADLPGYGYAAVARDAKLRWQRVMADYLSERESLSGVVLMVDSRLGLTDLDKQLLEFVSDRVTAGEVSLLVLLTKADKLNRKEGAAVLAKVQQDLAVLATEDSDIAITLFSALSKQGLEDVAELLHDWAHREPRVLMGDGDELTGDEAVDAEVDADADADADLNHGDNG